MNPKARRAIRWAVAVAVRPVEDPGGVLAVLRPPDDPDLPDVWGLPAVRRRPGEGAPEAVVRTGREKLGLLLSGIRRLASGATEREGYRLEMELYEAVAEEGEPSVPQPGSGSTQYTRWRWASAAILEEALERGSLCCRLYFEAQADADSGAREEDEGRGEGKPPRP